MATELEDNTPRVVLLRTLNLIGDAISGRLRNEARTFDGRSGSMLAEECVKQAVLDHAVDVLHTPSDGDARNGWRVIGFDAEIARSEARSRDMADVTAIMSDGKAVIERIPINVKVTRGKTADNVCGWNAFSYCTCGVSLKRDQLLDGITSGSCGLLQDDIHDYFLWTFYKDDTGRLSGLSLASSLLCATSCEMLRYNASQPFPVQVRQPEHDTTLIMKQREMACRAAMHHAASQRRALCTFVFQNDIAYHERELRREQAAYRKTSVM